MLTFFLALIALTALLGLLFCKAGILSLVVVILGGAGVILKFLVFKKFSQLADRIVLIVISAVCILLMLRVPIKKIDHKIEDYYADVIRVEQMIAAGEKEIVPEIEKLEEIYGSGDMINGLYFSECLARNDFENAGNYLQRYSEYSMDYYYKKEAYLLAKRVKDSDPYNLYNMYIEAANRYPDWEYVQRMAGISYYEREEYASAKYYLAAAYELDPTIPLTSYYLGVLSYRTGDYESCLAHFENALNNGANEEIQSWIVWYLDQMEG